MTKTEERLHMLSRKFLAECNRVYDRVGPENITSITKKFYEDKHSLIKLHFIDCTVGINLNNMIKYTLLFPDAIMLMISPMDDKDCVISVFKKRELVFSDLVDFKTLPDKWNTITFK